VALNLIAPLKAGAGSKNASSPAGVPSLRREGPPGGSLKNSACRHYPCHSTGYLDGSCRAQSNRTSASKQQWPQIPVHQVYGPLTKASRRPPSVLGSPVARGASRYSSRATLWVFRPGTAHDQARGFSTVFDESFVRKKSFVLRWPKTLHVRTGMTSTRDSNHRRFPLRTVGGRAAIGCSHP